MFEMTELYKKTEKQSEDFGDKNCCVLIAACILTGKSYKEVYDAAQKAGRKKHKGMNGILERDMYKILGYKIVTGMWKNHANRIRKNMPKWYKCDKLTTKQINTFKNSWIDEPDMLIYTNRHVSAYKDKQIHDYAINKKKVIIGVSYIKKIENENDPFDPMSLFI
jgi:hypothetical protein